MPPSATAVIQRSVPDFVKNINDDYLAQVSHVFILHGNIYDFVDNAGNNLGIQEVLASCYDTNIQRSLNPNAATSNDENGVQSVSAAASRKTRIMAFYNSSTGLVFPDARSRAAWVASFNLTASQIEDLGGDGYFSPVSIEAAMALLNQWFVISKRAILENGVRARENRPLLTELVFTLIFTDSDTLFPAGDIANLGGDRPAIVNIRNWAQDPMLGKRNKIILMTRDQLKIHESIRAELAVSHVVRKPDLHDRTEWIRNFDLSVQRLVAASGAQKVGDNLNVTGIMFSPEFDLREFALQSAGMNRRQIKDVILKSWRTNQPVDFQMVQEIKKRALDAEYGGMIDILEPKFGFDEIGGHEHFKNYCRWKIIRPLKEGYRKLCSRGVLMTGPPGTGKSMIAWALAKEAGLNFIQVDLGKVFAGLVGATEANIRKMIEAIEAASPCIAFFDEVDSVLSSGRSSAGDSGTSARVFNNFMTWLSDPSRRGKVVAMFASNRPDLLDTALIRAGRVDAKIPMLAPAKGDAKGRWSILVALTKKHKIVLSSELLTRRNITTEGLGLLLGDANRIWTGAEMEQLLEAALDEAMIAERTKPDGKPDMTIQMADWNAAFDNIIPNTREVERMTNLALLFADNLRYVPSEWKEQARDKEALQQICSVGNDRMRAEREAWA